MSRRTAELILLGAAALAGCRPSSRPAGKTEAATATYVGRPRCVECHAREGKAWVGSRHDLAMQPADSTTVLADFTNTRFTYTTGLTTTFSRRNGEYWVRTDGPDGNLTDYKVAYTFGVYPLQQYLIAFPGGRYQSLNVVWDTRTKPEGGQRWFHLYPNEKVDSRDVLHWTGPLQNWNYMCAECHSTNVRKNYDPQKDSYQTAWSEINVSCEACHGPGSRHLEWARPENQGRRDRDPSRGLAVSLRPVAGGTWVFDSGKAIARRATPPASRVEVETCARCHARRATVWEGYQHGQPLAQTHRISLLDEELYFADGQQQEEVYEYGSFLQSRMARAGVTCSDCHDPHRGALRAPGRAICAKCHLPTKYDLVSHHRHKPGTPAADCLSCHMPATNYMGVDARRDHGFGIPRPDLSILLHTPNPCTGCHTDQPAAWAANAVEKWFGPRDSVRARYAVATSAGREGWPGAGDVLIRVAQDTGVSAIQRATAVSLMSRNPVPQTLAALQTGLGDPDPLVRRAAVEAIETIEPTMRLRMGVPLLADSVRTVRLAAVGVLAAIPPAQWTPEQRRVFEQGLPEYREAQRANADRAESHLNLGGLAADLGQPAEAEKEFRTAIRLWPGFAPGHLQLAELLRATGREAAADSALRIGLGASPSSAELHHALGLSLVRQNRKDEAITELAVAATLRPEMARYAFVYGVALHDTGDPAKGLAVLLAARQRHPWDRDMLQGVVSFAAEAGRRDVALEAARRLVQLSPGDQELRRQLQSLEPQ